MMNGRKKEGKEKGKRRGKKEKAARKRRGNLTGMEGKEPEGKSPEKEGRQPGKALKGSLNMKEKTKGPCNMAPTNGAGSSSEKRWQA